MKFKKIKKWCGLTWFTFLHQTHSKNSTSQTSVTWVYSSPVDKWLKLDDEFDGVLSLLLIGLAGFCVFLIYAIWPRKTGKEFLGFQHHQY